MKMRILVADDNERMLAALVSELSVDFEIVGTAMDGRSALEQIDTLQPTVAVLDLNMPELNGIEVTKAMMQKGIACSIVICSVESDPELIEAAQCAGALAYVLKPLFHADLVNAVKLASCGEQFVSCLVPIEN
jgi:DNA-binding NarL/FixJ family response regulator